MGRNEDGVMPVFMLAKAFIDAIVATAIHGPRDYDDEWHFIKRASAFKLGSLLVESNRSAVERSHPGFDKLRPGQQPNVLQHWLSPYEFPPDTQPLKTLEAVAALDLIEYHCDSPDWDGSEGHKFCASMRRIILPGIDGYEKMCKRMMMLAIGEIESKVQEAAQPDANPDDEKVRGVKPRLLPAWTGIASRIAGQDVKTKEKITEIKRVIPVTE